MTMRKIAIIMMACVLLAGCSSVKAETAETAATATPATAATATPATVRETEDTIVSSKKFTNVTITIVLNKRKLRVIFDEGNGGEEFLEQELDEAEYHEALNRLHDETKREDWFHQLHTIR